MTVWSFLSRVALIAVGYYTIKKLVYDPPVDSPTQEIVEQTFILSATVGTYGFESTAKLAGLTIAEMSMLTIIVLAASKFSRTWYLEHKRGAPHETPPPPAATAGGYRINLNYSYTQSGW